MKTLPALAVLSSALYISPLLLCCQSLEPPSPEPKACEIYLVFEKTPWDRPQEVELGAYYEREMKWWEAEGQKKYPDFCAVSTRRRANFAVVWSSTWRHEERLVSTPQQDASSSGNPGVPRTDPAGTPSAQGGRMETYVVEQARMQVFEVRDGALFGKPIFKTNSQNDRKLILAGADARRSEFLTVSMFQQALKSIAKRVHATKKSKP